ncbi:MAG: LLM class flavin-dependent oxidoreductase [Betaproteobacteria bacterium]|nr:LLM class flavin-dependent oxidoreductase [Betaproteobacteria bacterium]
MKMWHFSENPYPPAWRADPKTVRVTLPNRHFDPKVGSQLINRYLDEWIYCDEIGFDIMVNEHHSTSTCLSSSCMPPLAILSRQTKKARLLVLGVPIGIRSDPLLVAEELSYIDVVSGGRLEMGLVKGVAVELTAASVNPSTLTARFWEAHDLIMKAMTTHDGPFNFQGEFFQHRHVNIWPRPYQEPHPPVWMTSFGPQSTTAIADHGYNICAGLVALGSKHIFNAYRARIAELGRPAPTPEKFGYLVLIGVGRTEAEGHARVRKVKQFFESSEIVPEPFPNPAGYAPPEAHLKTIRAGGGKAMRRTSRDGTTINFATASVPELIHAGACFAGTPDQVVGQIEALYDYLGGFGHILGMTHGGDLSHEDTLDSMKLFADEVMPRLQHLRIGQTAETDAHDAVRASAQSA